MAKLYKYTVIVRPSRPANFPVDMLRYDGLHPKHERDSGTIERAVNEPQPTQVIELAKVWPDAKWQPNYDRWHSFGWIVVSVERDAWMV